MIMVTHNLARIAPLDSSAVHSFVVHATYYVKQILCLEIVSISVDLDE